MLLAVGEVVGFIGFSKVTGEDVEITGDSIHMVLPAPEICYCKIDHQRSRIYNVGFGW
jgi:hypothetical protein